MADDTWLARLIGKWKPAPVEDDASTVECPTHGDSSAAFICGHLVDDPRQEWFCAYPSEDKRWPDAWCGACDAAYQKEGEWNEKNEHLVDIKLICSGCYDASRAESADTLAGDALEGWRRYVQDCHAKVKARQSALWEEYRLGEYERWDWDQHTGELVFSDGGVPRAIARIEFIGSVSSTSNTWLWAWANFHLLESVRTAVLAVRDFGEGHGYPRLTVSKWPADEIDGWEMASIAAEVLGARGVYRTPGERGSTFLAIMDVRWAGG